LPFTLGESGVATLNFGTGAHEASVSVGGTPIVPEAHIEVHLAPIPGASPSGQEDHLVAPIELRVGAIIPGAGFTVYGRVVGTSPQRRYGPPSPTGRQAPKEAGQFGVAWSWKKPSA